MQNTHLQITTHNEQHPFSHIPLWVVLIIPFILIIITVVGSSNYLAYDNSQKAIDNIAQQLLFEIGNRIEAHLDSFLAVPERINRHNAQIIQSNLLDITDLEAISHYFWEEIQVYDTVTSIYFGNPDGGLVSGGREGADGSLYIITTENFASGKLNKYATDTVGNLDELLVSVPQFDSRVRPWYIGAVEHAQAYWTAPYVLSTGQDLAIASSLPVYDDNNNLLGVASIDIFITHIRSFLQSLEIGKTGQAYIVDHNGDLVATSSDTPTFIRADDGSWNRISALDSDNTIIAASATYITQKFGGWLDSPQQLTMTVNQQQHYLTVSAFHNDNGLDWLVVITVPKNDFLGTIQAQARTTIALIIIAIVIASITGTLITILILRPITQLGNAAKNLAKGDLTQKVAIAGVRETRILGLAFNNMSTDLHEAFTNLEARIAARTAELATSEARFRAVIEDQTDLICRYSPQDYTVTFANAAYCRFVSKPLLEVIGKSFMPFIYAEDRIFVQEQLGKLNVANPIVKVEHRNINTDGDIYWTQWVNRALFDESNTIIEVQSVGRDITATKQFQVSLQRALDREIELSELKSQFISTVSHEFRTPLTIIMNSSEILHRYGDRIDKAMQADQHRKIKDQIIRMTDLLEDVLTISRDNLGDSNLKLEIFDIGELCQNIIDEIQSSLVVDMSFKFSTFGNCSAINADKRLVRLILTNLIVNAAKYSLPNSTITVTLSCNDNQTKFHVQDEGIGIPKANQKNIFEPFYRADNATEIIGTGLGLAIVKRSVEQHGGTISFVSNEAQGSTFTVIIPNNDISNPA